MLFLRGAIFRLGNRKQYAARVCIYVCKESVICGASGARKISGKMMMMRRRREEIFQLGLIYRAIEEDARWSFLRTVRGWDDAIYINIVVVLVVLLLYTVIVYR